MSGYLQRLAARSVGASAAASALPRLPARFETSAGDGARGLEILDEEITAGGARPAPAPHVPGDPNVRGTRHEAPSGVPGRPARAASRREAVGRPGDRDGAARGGAAPGVPAAQAAGARAPAAPAAAPPRAPASPAGRPAEHASAPTRASAVPAMPAAQARPPLAVERREPQTARQVAEAPVVRVHIGRLEVRANLQPAPAAVTTAARADPPREEFGLSAYLRGERGGR